MKSDQVLLNRWKSSLTVTSATAQDWRDAAEYGYAIAARFYETGKYHTAKSRWWMHAAECCILRECGMLRAVRLEAT